MVKQYNQSIDIAKGSLIVLVIIGHVLYGSLSENFIRFFIYSFHMPLFLFISGYLIDLDRLCSQNIISLLKHYSKRMIISWSGAWIVYTSIIIKDFSLEAIIENIINPWYHLWYVPSLFVMICAVYTLRQITNNNLVYYSLIGLMGISSLVIGCIYSFPTICLLSYFIYFVLGVYIRNLLEFRKIKKYFCVNRGGICITYSIIMLINFLLMQNKSFFLWRTLMTFLPLVIFILFWFYPLIKTDRLPHIQILALLGKHSLPIYLWHMIPIILITSFLEKGSYGYYFICLFFFVAFTLVTKYCINKS